MWLALALVAVLILSRSPLRCCARRAREQGEADVALFHAQLAELETPSAPEGRLDEAAHKAATVEVQRRLLAAPPPSIRPPPSTPRPCCWRPSCWCRCWA